MNHFHLGCLLVSALGLNALAAPSSVLVWSDEFDTPGLPDPAKWDYDVGGSGMGNQESQLYTRARPKNAWVDSGVLRITGVREDTGTCWYGSCKFTSARLVTRGRASWRYGRIEVRAKLPKGRGVWPAIWMLSSDPAYGWWPSSGEIDIMEAVGYDPKNVYGTVHTLQYNHKIGTSKGSSALVPSQADSFHVYSLDWRPDSLFIGLDGKHYFGFGNEGSWETWPFDLPFHLLLNLAIGGSWGGLEGVDSTIFPQRMLVDWVRVSKVAWTPGPFRVEGATSTGGRVLVEPSGTSVPALSKVVLRAVPEDGWEFSSWESGADGRTAIDTILVDRDLVAKARFLPAGERITNGTFDKGTNGWNFWFDETIGATLTTTDGMACVQPSAQDPANPWKVQLTYPGLSVVKGETYDLKLFARPSASRTFETALLQAETPFAPVAPGTTFTVPPQGGNFSHRFVVATTQSKVRLEFDFGASTAGICLDSVSLRKAVPLAAETARRSAAGVRALPGALELFNPSDKALAWRWMDLSGVTLSHGEVAPSSRTLVRIPTRRTLTIVTLDGQPTTILPDLASP